MFEDKNGLGGINAAQAFLSIIGFGILVVFGVVMVWFSGEYSTLYIRTSQAVDIAVDGKVLTPCNAKKGCWLAKELRRQRQFRWGILTGSTYTVDARKGGEVIASFKLKPKPGKIYSYGLDADGDWTEVSLPEDAEPFSPDMSSQ